MHTCVADAGRAGLPALREHVAAVASGTCVARHRPRQRQQCHGPGTEPQGAEVAPQRCLGDQLFPQSARAGSAVPHVPPSSGAHPGRRQHSSHSGAVAQPQRASPGKAAPVPAVASAHLTAPHVQPHFCSQLPNGNPHKHPLCQSRMQSQYQPPEADLPHASSIPGQAHTAVPAMPHSPSMDRSSSVLPPAGKPSCEPPRPGTPWRSPAA